MNVSENILSIMKNKYPFLFTALFIFAASAVLFNWFNKQTNSPTQNKIVLTPSPTMESKKDNIKQVLLKFNPQTYSCAQGCRICRASLETRW